MFVISTPTKSGARSQGLLWAFCSVVMSVALFLLPASINATNALLEEVAETTQVPTAEEEVKHTCTMDGTGSGVTPPGDRRTGWPSPAEEALPHGERRVLVPPPKRG
ncbi:MAG: hypothetical protein KA175_13105 [Flavobacteriales bacterium]|nr:hypothetical protein [Flavobacteriales bacterium]MBP6698551.1 hypothetical protein [Flavobacteriales bacterium]